MAIVDADVDLKKWNKYRKWAKEVSPIIDVGPAFERGKEREALAIHLIRTSNGRARFLGSVFSKDEQGFSKEEFKKKVSSLLSK